MNIGKWNISLFVIGFLISMVLNSCSTSPTLPRTITRVEELETYINNLVDYGSPQGMSLVVVKNGKIIYEKGFGWADRPRKIAATSGSVYHWWSITKIATAIAIAILQLREQGKVQ